MAQRQTVLDKALRKAANELIGTFGRQVIIRKKTRTVRPGQGDVSATSTSPQSVLAYVAQRDREFSGSGGNSEDAVLQAWVDHIRLSWVPTPGDELILGTDASSDPIYSIDAVQEVFSGEQVAVVKIDLGL